MSLLWLALKKNSAVIIFVKDKKVLLSKRKRHTARHVVSARYAVLVGVPFILTWDLMGWYPHPADGGTPQPDLG